MEENKQKIKIENHTGSFGLWFAAWLFTVLALVLWPYYLGSFFSAGPMPF
jgi:hypothetical protein